MAESAVSILANQLSTWLQDERKLLGGLAAEVQIVHGELEQMRAFLRVADESEITDPRVKVCVRQVQEISYDIEDLLEDYMRRFPHYPAHGITGRVKKFFISIKQLRAKHNTATEIKALRLRVESAFKTFSNLYPTLPRPNSSSVTNDTHYDGRGDALLLEEADVVGIEGPRKQLLQWISTADYTLKVVSVVGMAGLGKTTLVKKVYDDSSVKVEINHHAWLTVSQTYKVENLLQQIIKQLFQEVKQAPPHDLENMDADALRKFVYDFLVNKNYVIVLDDVWSKYAWEALCYAFPRSTTSGRGCIIITTRSIDIGEGACHDSGDHVYHLQPLLPKESEKLFYRKAFGSESSCPQQLKEISENILKSCDGLPLAIVVIGGILATKRNDIGEWKRIGSNMRFDGNKRIEKIISLSYYDLPYYLKPCFLFLSIFPEDHFVRRDTIMRLWIAEGFIEAKQGKNVEEMAYGYLNELSNRSLIQVDMKPYDRRATGFRIHDVVREYIISKAEDEDMVTGKGTKGKSWNSRRLRLDDDSRNQILQVNNFRCVRTLLFFGSVNLEWESIIAKVFNGGCRMLRELDLRGVPMDEVPNEVFKLYHLKYLCLKETNVSMIPKSIGNLVKLETLDLYNTRVTKLPMEVVKLRRLSNLIAYRYDEEKDLIQGVEAPIEIGQLLCLQVLFDVDASAVVEREGNNKIVREVGKLRELRVLGIAGLQKEEGKELWSSLAKLPYITQLSIQSSEEGNEVIDLQDDDDSIALTTTCLQSLEWLYLSGRLERRLPQWIASLHALTSLSLMGSRMVEDPVESLEALPNLQYLVMDGAYDGEGLSFKGEGFQRLLTLRLWNLRELKRVRVEKGCMPCLKEFQVVDCKAMVEIPMGIEHLTQLNHVEFCNMAEEFWKGVSNEKKRDGEEGSWKLGHIPHLEFLEKVDGIWKRVKL